MGVFKDIFAGAAQRIANQAPPNINYLAELQRQKEYREQMERQKQIDAFNQMMDQQSAALAEREFAETQAKNKADLFDKQTTAAENLGLIVLNAQNVLQDNAFAREKFEKVEMPESRARISNHMEQRAPTQEEFMWQQMTPEQQQAVIKAYPNKFRPPSGGTGGSITPSMLSTLHGRMNNPIEGGTMGTPLDSAVVMAGRMKSAADSLNAVGGQPQMPAQTQQTDPMMKLYQRFQQDPKSLSDQELDQLEQWLGSQQ